MINRESVDSNTRRDRNIAMDYLKGILTILVVLHHVSLSYTSHGIGALIIDHDKFIYSDYIVGILDKFFMPTFFLVSGLFVWDSVKRRGVLDFLKVRFIRLGIPFITGWLVFNIPAYYFSYLADIQENYGILIPVSVKGFLEFWSKTIGTAMFSGHLWFLWELLVFNIIIAGIYKVMPDLEERIRGWQLPARPLQFMILLFISSLLVYWPISGIASGWFVSIYGPLVIQLNRSLLYLLYFSVGVVIGIYGLGRSYLRADSVLVKRWWLILSAGLLSYITIVHFTLIRIKEPGNLLAKNLVDILFILVCMFMSTASYALLAKIVKKSNNILASLSRNAYGIYIFHYTIVTSWQFIFFRIDMTGGFKLILVFILSFFTTWLLVRILRLIPIIKRIIG